MDFDVKFTDNSIVITNNGPASKVPLSGSNAINLPNGAVINPPSGTYWHIQTVSGGAVLEGTHGPLEMPSGSSATFNTDNL